ncbi:MAG: ACP S-malonyltransferase [Bacteroidia bacterium]
MKTAYLFPGQGSQKPQMGKALYERHSHLRELFEKADAIVGFNLTEKMFTGSAEELTRTSIAQPALYVHGYAVAQTLGEKPDAVAGHSLGEFTALAVAGVFSYEEGLELVRVRAQAMQKACDATESTMAAIIGLPEETVEALCHQTSGIVKPANYNSPGQIVISGEIAAVETVIQKAKAAGAKLAKRIAVNGAFHSPLMQPAQEELAAAIRRISFRVPQCPIFMNVSAQAETEPIRIQDLLIAQLTAPVKWQQSLQAMYQAHIRRFIECGPGTVLQGLVKRTLPDVEAHSIES